MLILHNIGMMEGEWLVSTDNQPAVAVAMHPDRLKHLEMLQQVITRMASNSFLIKGWSITLISALLAFAQYFGQFRYD
ncbi:MAG: hypothetical protein RI964_2748 [Pseudomonadota bacterium]|jgi:hypothetical protein